MTTTTKFKLFEEKKHSVRYNAIQEGDDPVNAVSIYVNKAVLPKPFPQAIKVTVEST